MIKKLLILSVSIIFLFSTSCLPDDACGYCAAVTYDRSTGQEVDRQDETEYCGDELVDKELSQAYVSGNDSTVWECY